MRAHHGNAGDEQENAGQQEPRTVAQVLRQSIAQPQQRLAIEIGENQIRSQLALPVNLLQRSAPEFEIVPKPVPTRREEDDISEAADPILDKIAKSGIGSLTPSERRTLDRARNRLLKESK